MKVSRVAGLWALAVDRPVATLMIAIGVAVFGYLSYGQLSLALMPELSYPTLTVRTEFAGAAPEEVEAEITKPLEEFLRTVEGVRSIRSMSRAGLSDVILEFQWDTDMDYASQRVRERVDIVTFPRAAQRPLTLRYDPDLDPIMRIGVHGEADLTKLRTFSEDEVARAIEKIKGVAIVKVHGGRERIVRVDLNQRRMSQLGLSIAEVRQRLASENVNLAGGQIEDGGVRYLVRTLNEFADIEELKKMSVGSGQEGSIRLADVASVYLDHKDREVITHIAGRESVELEIFKEADANLVSVSTRVREKLFGNEAQRKFAEKKAATPTEAQQKKEGADRADKEGKKGKSGRAKARAARERQMTDFLSHDLPEEIKLEILSDQAAYVKSAIDEVVGTAFLGGICAILVLFLFLRSSANTLIIATAIPLSIVATFALMRMVGVTLNIMSLGGLALGIGMLVDNSIVVLESIHRCREEGDDTRLSAIRGTKEVGSAVTASTLTTIAVFFPIVFIEGVAGQLFDDLAMTVVFSLLASLVVALFVVPMLTAWRPNRALTARGPDSRPWWRRQLDFKSIALTRADFALRAAAMRSRSATKNIVMAPLEAVALLYLSLRGVSLLLMELVFAKLLAGAIAGLGLCLRWLVLGLGAAARLLLRPVVWAFDKAFGALQSLYPRVLRAALNHRLVIIVLATALFAGGLQLFDQLGMELIPELHQGEFRAEVRMPVGTRLEDTALEVGAIEAALADTPGLVRHSSFVGSEKTSTSEGDEGEHSATIHLQLEATRDIEGQELRAMRSVRQVLGGRPGVQSELVRPTLFSLQTPIQVEISGHDLRLLKLYSDRITEILQDMDELTDIRPNLRQGYPEVQIRFDRKLLSAYGLGIRQVAEVVQDKIRGQVPSELHRDERRIDILVRVRRQDVATVEDLKDLVVGFTSAAPSGDPLSALANGASAATRTPVLLGSVAQVQIEEGPSEIRHLDGQRTAVIEANTTGLDLQSAIDMVTMRLAEVRLPRGFSLTVGGQSKEIDRARYSLLLALLLAIFLVYIVMASQFESILAPLVIIFTIPLAALGVAGALWLTRTPLSVVVFIGMIMLAGIVVNNAIVLIDYAIQLHKRGMPHRDALVQACSVRLRPVLITTLTTVLGLLPMALGLGEGAEIRTPMALTVIAGLTSSTILTLLVIPVVYDLVNGRTTRGDEAPETPT